MPRRFLRCVLFAVAASLSAFVPAGAAEKPDSWGEWQSARTLYDAGRLQESLAALQSTPSHSANFYYNVGTLYYRLGDSGKSVAYLEKANRLRAHDPDIQFNLTAARKALSQNLGEGKLDPASNWLESVADRIPVDEIRGTIGLVAFIVLLLWVRAYLKTRRLLKALLQPAGMVAVFAFLITATIYIAHHFALMHPPAAALETTAVRSGPGDQFLELGRVDSGMKIRLLGPVATASSSGVAPASDSAAAQELWHQVRYSAEGVGWIKASSLLLL